MKTLIVYYSFTGNNDKLAHRVQEIADCDLLKIEPRSKRTNFTILLDFTFNRKPEIKSYAHRISDYDQLILMAPVWMGRIASPLKTFLLQEKASMHSYSFITVCGGGTGQKERLTKELTRHVGFEPIHVSELWLNSLLSARKDTLKNTTSYQLTTQDLKEFDLRIREFIQVVMPELETV
jgi:flavodoxin